MAFVLLVLLVMTRPLPGNLVLETCMRLLLALGVITFIQMGCAAPRVRIDEAGSAGHRAEAEKERAAAAAHREQFDPYARVTRETRVPVEPGLPVMEDAVGTNPTSWHLTEAAEHEAHAHAHVAAATALEHFEARECAAIPPRERNACPVLIGASAVTDIDNGVRIDFRTEADTARLAARMRCHLAYARAIGFDRAPYCPLYMKGVDVVLSAGGHAIEVLGDRRGVVTEIRKRVADLAPIAH